MQTLGLINIVILAQNAGYRAYYVGKIIYDKTYGLRNLIIYIGNKDSYLIRVSKDLERAKGHIN